MFKNCCGCPGKKTSRKESGEEEDEEKKEEKTTEEAAEEKSQEPTAKLQEEDEQKPQPPDAEATGWRKPSSMKKPKPRLSISAEVKIIPSNFPEEMENYPLEEEAEIPKDEPEEEEEEDEPEEIKIPVKDIDGKIIRKSQSTESLGRPSPAEGAPRPVSPLSDEVFVANEKSNLELPLHNLGVKLEKALPLGLDSSGSPKRGAGLSQKRVSMPAVLPKWLSEEDETGGSHEPPATPVARDELALRRHRFFSELLTVAQAATEHRVRFDPFGPTIEILAEVDQGSTQAQTKELENLISRLENITLRLEKAVPLLEKGAEACARNLVVTKSLEDLLDEHLTPTEKENLNLLIHSRQSEPGLEGKEDSEEKDGFIIISPDSSADFEELSDKDLVLIEDERIPPEYEKAQNNASDRSENSSNSQNTVVSRVLGEEEEERRPQGKSDEVKEKEDREGFERLAGEKETEMTNSQSTLSMSVQGFQQVLQGPFASYLQTSAKIGGDVAEHSKIVQEAFQAQLQYLSLAAQSAKPSQTEEMKLLQPTSQRIQAIQGYREKKRTSSYFNHLSAVSESIPALGWVTISPAPAPFIEEMNCAGQFYANRVLKDWKEKDKIHVDWTKAWIQTLSELQAFVKQYHTTGLTWGGTSAPRAGAAPPPPSMLDLGDVAPAGPGQDRSALFAEINQGENITRSQPSLSMSVQGFQQVLQGPFASYLQASAKIGGDVAEHSKIVQEAFRAQLQYLSLAAQSAKPSQTEEMKLLQPTSQRIEAIQGYREKKRTSNYFNHLSAVSESIPALGWVTISPAPAPFIEEMNCAGQFYANRVLKDWKEKDKVHVDWTKAWIQTLSELQAFVKQYHTTGLTWGGMSAPRAGAAPPPPPGGMPPPPPMLDLGDVALAGQGQDRSALFAEINQGENITRNLKKVSADMQTHKNPGLRAGPAPFKSPPASITNQVPKPFKAPSPPEKPPKFAREGKKWFIEHQKGNHQLVVENAEMNNVVYVFKCSDSTLVVKGKVNSIFLDSCKKTAVVFDSVVSSIEFVNCQSVQMQVLGMVPTISIDKTDGCQMYLSQDSLNVEVVSSKSSEMNVLVPTGSGDFKEFPIPEQFKTTVSKQGLKTIAVESKG